MGRLVTVKTLAGFDFAFQPSLDRNRILALAQLEFIDFHEVVHFLGQAGCGKTHLAIALGVEAVKAGRGVYFCTLAELIASLAKAEREGTLRERLRFLCRPQLLIVDEIGYLPVVPGGGNLFFQLVNSRYERGAHDPDLKPRDRRYLAEDADISRLGTTSHLAKAWSSRRPAEGAPTRLGRPRDLFCVVSGSPSARR